MAQRYFLKRALLGSALLLATVGLHAQSVVPDSAQAPQRPPTLLGKAGLRLTRLRYSHDNQAWQFLLPLSLGAEYRVAPRLSLYTQLEADLLTSYASGRRRGGQKGALSAAAAAALGVRYYYGRAHQAAPIFGRYVALEGSADWEQLTNGTSQSARRQRTTPTVLTPGVYALWGVQHRLRPHVLYDLNAGAGVLAPAYYNVERPSGSTHWNVGGQVNLRLYFSL